MNLTTSFSHLTDKFGVMSLDDVYIHCIRIYREREAERQRGRETERQRDGQTD